MPGEEADTTLTLNDGVKVPQVGLGTWQGSKDGEESLTNAIIAAVKAGYRHFDTAKAYQNEETVGKAVNQCITDGLVTREELFIVTKLWNIDHHKDHVMPALREQLELLQLDYVDLYLMHWPISYVHGEGTFPKNDKGKFKYTKDPYTAAWKAMEACVEKGLTKAVGLSNFNSRQIAEIISISTIKPAMLQIEVNPFLNQDNLLDFCSQHSITVTAYSPFGSPARPWVKEGDANLLESPKVKTIAENLGKTPAQVLVRYAVQRGLVVIPKSANPERIAANRKVFDFTLDSKQMKQLHGMETGKRAVQIEWVRDHPYYPFKEADKY